MLDSISDQSFDQASESEPSGDSVIRRQYTIKGVEAEAIELMREAARHEGMKIGAWVSARLKEAAVKSLADWAVSPLRRSGVACRAGGVGGVRSAPDIADDRLSRLEKELVEISSAQRVIMSSLLKRH